MQDRPDARDKNPPATHVPNDEIIDDVGDGLESDQPHEALTLNSDHPRRTVELTSAPAASTRQTPDMNARQAPSSAPLVEPGSVDPGSPENPRTFVTRDRSWMWPIISLVGLAVVVLVNWLANWIPFNDQTTGQIANRNPVPFQPAGWAFSIWGLIYVLLFVFVVYSFLPAGRHSSRIQRVGPLFLVANIANISWLLLWHYNVVGASLIAMVVLLASLLGIYSLLWRRADNPGKVPVLRRLIVRVPFSVYLGWIAVAILANIQIWMSRGGWDGGPFGLQGWAVIFLVAGVLVAAAIAFFAHDAAYPLVFVWGYLGIAQEQWDSSKLISILAILMVIVAAALAAMAFLLSFDSRTKLSMPMPLRRREDRTPPAAS